MKKVIYTCLAGDYDRLAQPEAVRRDWDYICFTERDGKDGVWELRRIPPEIGNDAVTLSRYPKLLPHAVLPDYELSVYMDANIRITGDSFYDAVEALAGSGTVYAGLPHPRRDCVWEELRFCYLKGKISTGAAFRHHAFLRRELVPRHWGLYENNVIVRLHNDPAAVALDDLWWKLFLSCSGRDQLTLVPALLKTGIRPSLILGEGVCARNSDCLGYTLHPSALKNNTPGRVTWGDFMYHVRLAFRKTVLLFFLK